MSKQLECRIVITHYNNTFMLGMYDPISFRYEDLGTHATGKIEEVVGKLKASMEKVGHRVTFSEMRAPR